MDRDDRRRLLRYETWANREVLAALSALPDPPPKAVGLLAHILASRTIWLDRMLERPASAPVWPDWGLPEVEARIDRLEDGWRAYSESLGPERLNTPVAYADSRGNPFSTRPLDIFLHIAMHGPYHRGQIAAILGAAGLIPPPTDFIVAVRRDLVP